MLQPDMEQVPVSLGHKFGFSAGSPCCAIFFFRRVEERGAEENEGRCYCYYIFYDLPGQRTKVIIGSGYGHILTTRAYRHQRGAHQGQATSELQRRGLGLDPMSVCVGPQKNLACWTVLRPATALATPSQLRAIKKSITRMHRSVGVYGFTTFPLWCGALPVFHTAFSSANVIQYLLRTCAASK